MPKRVLRLLAWAAGLASFATTFGAIAAAPKPATSAPPPRQVIIRRIVRNVYTTVPGAADTGTGAPKVKIVYVGGATAPAAPATTSGSHP
jgi:hypothetical protein